MASKNTKHPTLLTMPGGYYHWQKGESRIYGIVLVTRRVIKSDEMSNALNGKTILITGGAKRVGKIFALACARSGADVVIHHGHSTEEANRTQAEINQLARRAWIVEADLSDPAQAASLIPSFKESIPLHGLVNSAAIFESLSLET